LDIGVLGYIGIVWPKEHSPEVRSFPPGTPCIYDAWSHLYQIQNYYRCGDCITYGPWLFSSDKWWVVL